jgi:hypothetical protein
VAVDCAHAAGDCSSAGPLVGLPFIGPRLAISGLDGNKSGFTHVIATFFRHGRYLSKSPVHNLPYEYEQKAIGGRK